MPDWVLIMPPPGATPGTLFVADPVNHPNNTPGALLVKPEGVALSDSCCCEEETICCCPDFTSEDTAPATLTLTINGCGVLDGHTAVLTKTGGGGCVEYDLGSDVVGDCGSPVSMGWHLECFTDSATCDNFQLTLTRSTLNCAVNGGASHTSTVQSGCTCDPLDLTFTGFNIDDSGLAPGTCDCCGGGTFSVNITE